MLTPRVVLGGPVATNRRARAGSRPDRARGGVAAARRRGRRLAARGGGARPGRCGRVGHRARRLHLGPGRSRHALPLPVVRRRRRAGGRRLVVSAPLRLGVGRGPPRVGRRRRLGAHAAAAPHRIAPAPLRDRVVAELADRAVPGNAADGKAPVEIGESLEEFFVAAFGRSLTAAFFRPFNTKMWGHPPAELGHAWTSLRSGSTAPNVPEVDLSLARPHTPDDTSTFPFPTYGSGAVWSGVARALPADRQVYGDAAAALDSRERVVTLRDGHRIVYELVSSIPLPTLLALCSETSRPAVDAARLRHSGTHAVGLGFLGQPPPRLRDVSYVYVPDADVPVHRATVLSHYSPAMAGPGRWSLLFEAGCSPRLPVSSADALSSAIEQARRWDAEAAPVSVWQRFLPYGYPVPTLDRDRVLNRVQRWLESVGILSRGRFGGWRYESCNQDYAFMQGVEAVGAVLRGTPERVYWPGRQPAIAGPARACA